MSLRDRVMTLLENIADLSDIEELADKVVSLLADTQAAMVERCLCHVYAVDYMASGEGECLCGWHPDPATGHDFDQWETHVRALSPDPDYMERERRKEYIQGVKSVYVEHNHALSRVCGCACPVKLQELRAVELDRQLAEMGKG